MCVALESVWRCGLNYSYTERRSIRSQLIVNLKANSHITFRAHAVPLPCRAALIHTCHAAPLSCSDIAVSFVKVRVVAGNIRNASWTYQTNFDTLHFFFSKSYCYGIDTIFFRCTPNNICSHTTELTTPMYFNWLL
jgi:hypothetical protein